LLLLSENSLLLTIVFKQALKDIGMVWWSILICLIVRPILTMP